MASYDRDSGQVYREYTISRPALAPSHSRDWSRARPTATLQTLNPQGPRSLVDMAVRIVALNVSSLEEEHVEAMPPRVRLRVWQFLEARGANLHAWKLFSKYLLSGEEGNEPTLSQYRFRQHICKPDHRLDAYTQPLTSLSCDFITHLVISGGCDFSASEMLCLADMPNLGALELIQPADDLQSNFPEITDRLVRGWTNKPRPFPLLRILRIWGDQTTTKDSLLHLAKLPSLALYDVMGSRDDWRHASEQAQSSGWYLADNAPRMEDSLLRYLMLFAPGEETHLQRRKDLSARVDIDLASLCEDGSSEVRFVKHAEAPALLDYLTDGSVERRTPAEGSMRGGRGCKGVAFEPWAFWLYSFIGQISGDQDLRRYESSGLETQTVTGPFVLPAKMMACVFLGHNGRSGIATRPSYIRRGLFATQRYTFTRDPKGLGRERSVVQPERMSDADFTGRGERKIKARKRQRMDDLLGPFG